MHCPADLDKGGAANQYSSFGSNWVHPGTDINYEIEMKECSLDPESFQISPIVPDFKKAKPLRQFDMFHLIANQKNSFGKQMVLEASDVDKYAPLDTGVFNVFLNEKNNSDAQTWWYDGDAMTIHNKKTGGKAVLLEGANKNLVMYNFLNLAN